MKKSLLLIFSVITLAGCASEKVLPVADQADTEKIINEYESKLSEYEEMIRIYEEDTLGYSIIFPDEGAENDSTVYADESTESSSIGQYGNATPEELMDSFIFKGALGKDMFYFANFDFSDQGQPADTLAWFEEEFAGLTAEDISIEVYEGKYSEYAADVKVNGATKLAVDINYDSENGWVITDY